MNGLKRKKEERNKKKGRNKRNKRKKEERMVYVLYSSPFARHMPKIIRKTAVLFLQGFLLNKVRFLKNDVWIRNSPPSPFPLPIPPFY